MKIFIDGDGCPVVDLTMKIAKEYEIEVVIICDSAHLFEREGATTITVEKGADSVDFKLVNLVKSDDIVVTQDYGLAAMCLARKATPLNQNGRIFTNENIDGLLMQRHNAKKIRMAGGRTKGPAKRTEEQNLAFEKALRIVLGNKI